MNTQIVKKRNSFVYRAISLIVSISVISTAVIPPSYAQSITALNLPMPGVMVNPSPAFVPVLLKGMTIHPEDPFRFDFIVDSGNTDFNQDEIKKESEKLVKYFMASMTIPKDDLWVNLSPYESDRIIPDELGKTELGRDMLAQDYILKQLTASLIYPEDALGHEFWNKVYAKGQEKFGTTEIPMNTFNKVWIVPESATVYENDKTVYVVESHLKVLLEQDYLAQQNNEENSKIGADQLTEAQAKNASSISSQIVREIILPEIEKEVNQGKNFASLRQIYNSLILAKWYKETIKTSLLSQVYIDQKKTSGVELDDKTIKEQIYDQYMKAYKKGVFDFIKKDYDQLSQEVIPRKYFSGGEKFREILLKHAEKSDNFDAAMVGDNFQLSMRIAPQKSSSSDNAMVGETPNSPEGKEFIEKGLTFLRNEFKNSYEKILHFLEIDAPSSIVSLGRYEPAERDQGDGKVTYHYVITLQDMKKIEFFIKKTDDAEKEVDITRKAYVGVDGISIAPKVEFLQEYGQGYVLTLPALGEELSVSYFTEEIAYSIGRSLAILHSLGIRRNELSHEIHAGIDLFRSEHIFVSTKDGDVLTQFIDFGLSSIGSDNGQETRGTQSAVGLHGFYANNDNRNSSIVFQLGYYETAAKIREGILLNDGSSNLGSDKTFLINVLLSILVDRDESDMLDAIRILGYLKDNRAADVLGEVLLDEKIKWIQLREEAAEALLRIDHVKAQEFLTEALENKVVSERQHNTFFDTLAAINIGQKIGFNFGRFPKRTRIDFNEMNELYEAAVNSGRYSNGELTEEDLNFLRYYNSLFADEYFNDHTMSGYYNYAVKSANGINQRPEFFEPKARGIVETLNLKKGAKVLDIGCASGYIVQDLRKLGIDAEGLDISKFAIENSNEQYRQFLHFLDSLNFKENLRSQYYDLIILKDILEHVPEEILPRFWQTVSKLGAQALITLPVSGEDGEFINPRDRLDFTHLIKKNEGWWGKLLGYEYQLRPDFNTLLKKGQEAGTFCALVDLKKSSVKDSAQMSANDIKRIQNMYLKDLNETEITDTEKMLDNFQRIIAELRADPQLLLNIVEMILAQYRALLNDMFAKDEPALADYLYYKVIYNLAFVLEKEFVDDQAVYDLFTKKYPMMKNISSVNDKGPVRIALLGTAMVRAEPIKKEDYFQGKIQKKFLQPPFGVYRLEKYVYETFKEEIAQGKLMVDVFDPSLAFVSEEESLDELLETLSNGNYDIIGFSPIRVLLGEDLLFMNKVHELTKNSPKKPMYIAGGNEASMNAQVVFDSIPWLDFSISGLGEPVLHQILMQSLDSPSVQGAKNLDSFKDIPGIIYVKDGEIVKNDFRKMDHTEFQDYSNYHGENIPYDRYWTHNQSIGPVDTTFAGTRIETVRIFTRNFCPYNCPFCSQTIFGKQVYKGQGDSLTVDQIGHMIQRAYEIKGAMGVYFNDDDMFGSKENAKNILQKIINMKQEGLIPQNMAFYGQTRVDMVDVEVLNLVKKAGYNFLSYGVESFSDESLKGKDLRKSFKAEQAYRSVSQALKANIPITNMNLILFHPLVKKRSFITTVEKTIELLKVSIQEDARLSVNSFPLIEAYAGATINNVAKEESWPFTTDIAVTDNGDFEYIVNYLPIDQEMRKVVENDRLMKEFSEIMTELTEDIRWPSVTVSRSIGINSLVMFMAAYKILGIRESESAVQIEDMERLIWDLIKQYNPSIEKASNIFSWQKANIVFTKKYGRPLFRRSGMEIKDIPEEIVSKFAEKLDDDLLISLQNVDPFQMRDALHAIYYTDVSIEDAFKRFGIKVYRNFKKVLLVAPWGNYDGTSLKTLVPHMGLEQINHALIRDEANPDVDCRVFNPNLVGRDKLKELLQEEDFDVIAFSFMPVLLKNDAPLIDEAARYAPNALLIAGGLNIARLPFKDLFSTLPFDAYLIGPGEQVLSGLLRAMSKGSSKSKNLGGLKDIPNLVYFHEGQIQRTEQRAIEFATQEENAIKADVPYIQADLTHGTTYSQETHGVHSDILPYDMIGTNRLYVKISDICKGKCLFCSAPKERVKPVDLDEVIEFIKKNEGSFDSIHFSDNDLLYNRNLVMALTEKIMEAGLENIPKVAKSRTDEVDPELLRALRRAGFRILTFGVESFDDGILREMRKGTTADENRRALDMTLQEGIRPGMDMIFFSPWEDFNTLKTSLESALAFVERGAYLSLVPHMAIQMGDQTSKSGKVDIEYENIFFRSTGKTLHNPLKAKLPDNLELFRKKVLARRLNLITELKESLKDRNGGYVSFSVEGLLFAKAVYQLFIEEGIFTVQELNYNQMIQKIDRLIVRTIELEVAKYRGLPELNNNIESDRDAAIAEIKFKMKKEWDTQDSQIEDIIRRQDRAERLMKNESILDNKEDFFGLTAFLNHSREFVDEMKSVQMEIAQIIDDQEKRQSPDLLRTKKALYTDPETAHTTLNGNIMGNWSEREQMKNELEEEFRNAANFTLNVVGPHLMNSFAVTFELESDDWHLYQMKERGKVISERRNPQTTNPDIIHSSIAYIYGATEDQLLALNNKLREIREKNQESSIAISVDTLSVTKGGMDRRFRTEDTPWRLDISLKRVDKAMTPDADSMNIRKKLIYAAQNYIDFISQGDDFLPAVDAFFLLGNPDLDSFINFSKKWKDLKSQHHKEVPIVVAGGRGRGTKPLIDRVIGRYGNDLDVEELAYLRNLVRTESDILSFVLEKEEIPLEYIRKEEVPSKNTAENFINSKELLKDVLAKISHPVIAIVTSPPLLMRVKATAEKLWQKEINDSGWSIRKFQSYKMELKALTDEQLIEIVGYVAGYPQKYQKLYSQLNTNSELKGTQSDNNPNVKSVPLNREDWDLLLTLQDLFEQFLDNRNVVYSQERNHLIPQVTEKAESSDSIDPSQSTSVESPGGIDMNNINVNRQGSGVDIQFDPAMMQDILDRGVDGFVPVIINITPINSVMPLLGLEPRIREEEYLVSNLNSGRMLKN